MKQKHFITIQQQSSISSKDRTVQVNPWVNTALQAQMEGKTTHNKASKKVAVHFSFSKSLLNKRSF